jgi:tetratricopeptide (TPR) repeat protein
MLRRFGMVCTSLGNYDEAEPSLRSSMELCRAIEDQVGIAAAQEGLALLRVATERLEEAVDLFQELATLNRQMGQQRSVGLTLINLGKVLPRLGRPQEAVALLREAHGIFTGLADSDPYNGARVLIAMAHAQLSAGSLTEAKESATEAARRMRDLGSEAGEAEALETLGEIAHGYGDNSLSLRYLSQSLEIFTALGSPHATRLRERIQELGGLTSPGDTTAVPGSDSDHIP